MRAVILRIDAPMMSFGGVMVDQHGPTDQFPGKAMLTGLTANALGWSHGDFHRLQALQDGLDFAARWDVRPQTFVDYHTVDLGQPKMIGYADRGRRGDPVGGWTTRGQPEHRSGGTAARYGTHQRYRHYLADGIMTIALTVSGKNGSGNDLPGIPAVAAAFANPARPLFIGRKTCLPSRPLLDPDTPIVEGPDLLTILRRIPPWSREGRPEKSRTRLFACWPADIAAAEATRVHRVFDRRDWANQAPVAGGTRAEGWIEVIAP